MNINSDHITGFLIGAGAAALGYYAYKKNQNQIDEFLRKQGINMPAGGAKDYSGMSIEELMTEKENIEDIIAEREAAAQESPQPSAN